MFVYGDVMGEQHEHSSFLSFFVRIILEFIYFLNDKIKDLINHFKLYYTFYFGIVPIVLLNVEWISRRNGVRFEIFFLENNQSKFDSLRIGPPAWRALLFKENKF